LRFLRRALCRPVTQLNPRKALALLGMVGAIALVAASPAPGPTRVDVTKVQPKALLPKSTLHVEWVVETNKLGQVTRVRSGKPSTDRTFNTQTYGNALQAFIRTPDGHAVSGIYRLTYDYNPKTTRVRRAVALIRAGGVNANAEGAALQMESIAQKHTPEPAAPVKIEHLPALPQVMKTK
jgi:hypothetical protein